MSVVGDRVRRETWSPVIYGRTGARLHAREQMVSLHVNCADEILASGHRVFTADAITLKVSSQKRKNSVWT